MPRHRAKAHIASHSSARRISAIVAAQNSRGAASEIGERGGDAAAAEAKQ